MSMAGFGGMSKDIAQTLQLVAVASDSLTQVLRKCASKLEQGPQGVLTPPGPGGSDNPNLPGLGNVPAGADMRAQPLPTAVATQALTAAGAVDGRESDEIAEAIFGDTDRFTTFRVQNKESPIIQWDSRLPKQVKTFASVAEANKETNIKAHHIWEVLDPSKPGYVLFRARARASARPSCPPTRKRAPCDREGAGLARVAPSRARTR